jgi:polar amino acid transport system substrate-binding protein
MKHTLAIIALLISLLALAGSFWRLTTDTLSNNAVKPPKETAYARIMRTGVIRCGYFVWPPLLQKDPNTQAFSGIFYDYMTELGAALGLEIEWTQELAFGTFLQDIQAHRVDMECTGGWPNPTRGKSVDYTQPIFYVPIKAFVNESEHRFDSDPTAINSSDIRVVTIDGELAAFIRDKQFPLTQNVALPQSASAADLLTHLVAGKADLAITDAITGDGFSQANVGKLKALTGAPLMVMPNNLTVARGETELRAMVNVATQHLLNAGVIERILQKHEKTRGAYLRIARPYEALE